jgi:hypothetical protein
MEKEELYELLSVSLFKEDKEILDTIQPKNAFYAQNFSPVSVE